VGFLLQLSQLFMPEPNPNRQLDRPAVIELFNAKLLHLSDGLTSDRNWLWWHGPKPEEKERAILLEIGFQFTPRAHVAADGYECHWFHACGGAVIRRRGGKNRLVSSSKHISSSKHPADDAREALARIAALL
jgi:hypothetical protein